MKLKDIFTKEYKENIEEYDGNLDAGEGLYELPYYSTGSGKYCTGHLFVTDKENLKGFELWLHEELGWIDCDSGTWGKSITWETEVDVVDIEEIKSYQIK